MLELLAEDEPDADSGEWVELSLRLLNQRLANCGHRSNPQVLRQLLRSLSQDGKGLAGSRGSLELGFRSRHRYRARLLRSWRALRELAERRQAIGRVLLDTLLARVPEGASGRVLVEFSTRDLTEAIRKDLVLRGQIRDPLAAAERGLLFLHEQRVVHLQHGLAVFRQAMTIRIRPEASGRRYTRGDFAPLEQHYEERTFQVHVMARYAALGLEKIRAALGLVKDYFTLGKGSFVRAHFPGDEEELRWATGRESYRRIVESLGNAVQMALVAAPPSKNLLVLEPLPGLSRGVALRLAAAGVRAQRPLLELLALRCALLGIHGRPDAGDSRRHEARQARGSRVHRLLSGFCLGLVPRADLQRMGGHRPPARGLRHPLARGRADACPPPCLAPDMVEAGGSDRQGLRGSGHHHLLLVPSAAGIRYRQPRRGDGRRPFALAACMVGDGPARVRVRRLRLADSGTQRQATDVGDASAERRGVEHPSGGCGTDPGTFCWRARSANRAELRRVIV